MEESDENKKNVESTSYLRIILRVFVWIVALVLFVAAGYTIWATIIDIYNNGHPPELINTLLCYGVLLCCFTVMIGEIHLTADFIIYGRDELLRIFVWFVATVVFVAAGFVIATLFVKMYKDGHPRSFEDILICYGGLLFCFTVMIGEIHLTAVYIGYSDVGLVASLKSM